MSIVESLAPILAEDSDLEYCDTDIEDTDGENDGPAPGIQLPAPRISKGHADLSRTAGDDPVIVRLPEVDIRRLSTREAREKFQARLCQVL